MEYLLKSAGIIALFFIVYKLFLARDTFFHVNRIYFLVGMIGAIFAPLITIKNYVETTIKPALITSPMAQALVIDKPSPTIDWHFWFQIIYLIGLVISGIILVFQFANLYKKISKQPYKRQDKLKIIESDAEIAPFSFFNYIAYNPTQFTDSERDQLLKHEQTHAYQWHSIDTILVQLLICFQWFNPLVWLFKNELIQNLEYIADRHAKQIANPKNYSYLLLKTAVPKYRLELANSFYKSPLKNRIMMLHKNNSNRLNQLKFALIVPVLIGFIFTFNTEVIAQNTPNNKESIDNLELSISIDKAGSNEDFDSAKNLFKKYGFTIKFSKIKRNSQNELTGIKIEAKKESFNSEYAINGTEPIKPFTISYNDSTDVITIGSSVPKAPVHTKNGYWYSFTETTESDKPFNEIQSDTLFFDKIGDSIEKIKYGDKAKHVFNLKVRTGKKAVIYLNDIDTLASSDKNGTILKSTTFKIGEKGEIIPIINNRENDVINTVYKFDSIPDPETPPMPPTPINVKKLKKGDKNLVYIQKTDEPAILIIVDGKEINKELMEKIEPENIKSINVLKGIKATSKYGLKATNGVIEITTKNK